MLVVVEVVVDLLQLVPDLLVMVVEPEVVLEMELLERQTLVVDEVVLL